MNYRDRLEIYRHPHESDDFTPSDEPRLKVADIFAKLEPVSGSEQETASQQRALERFKITTRIGPKIAAMDATWWAERVDPLSGRSERYNFSSVRNVDGRNREFEIDAVREA